jgi:uncharacterized peroxidase-related enzyme
VLAPPSRIKVYRNDEAILEVDMSRIEPVELSQVDSKTASILKDLERRSGRMWNIALVMANAPVVLEIMSHLWARLDQVSLSPVDREIIDLEMAVQNGCHYCVPAHRHLARERGVAPVVIEQLSSGQTPSDPRAAVMQRLTRRLIETKGKLSDSEFRQFQQDGVTPQQMIEVIAEIAHCTMTNFMNRLANTDLDDFLLNFR